MISIVHAKCLKIKVVVTEQRKRFPSLRKTLRQMENLAFAAAVRLNLFWRQWPQCGSEMLRLQWLHDRAAAVYGARSLRRGEGSLEHLDIANSFIGRWKTPRQLPLPRQGQMLQKPKADMHDAFDMNWSLLLALASERTLYP